MPSTGDLVGRRLDLDVGAVAHGGFCVARHEGRVVFVRHALPGERVTAVVTEGGRDSRFLRADAVEVHTASAGRVEPPCPHARPGRCGGCDWQHAALPLQRQLKAAVVREQLTRLAGLDLPVTVEAVPGDAEGLGWRTRVRFAVDADQRLGLHKHRSHEIEPVERCWIAAPAIDELGVTRQPWPGAEAVEVVAASGGDRTAVVRPATAEAARRPPRIDGLTSLVAAADSGAAVRPVRGRTWVRERAAGREWRVSASGFWQVHPGAAEALVAAVLEGTAPRPGEIALDLYAGVGLFAGALAETVGTTGQVVAVESDPRASADARRNLHELSHVRVVNERVERAVRHVGHERVDLVVLDPPRSGAGAKVVAAIAALRPRAVAYVACDPAALARDIATFAGLGYGVASLRAFDLFPMTAHVECVAVLTEPAA